MIISIFFTSHWFLSLFSQTFFLHRYSAHQMFTMNKFWERFFHLFTFISQGSSYLNARGYAVLHRLHHEHSDTKDDPHSPKYYKTVFGMMWKTKKIYSRLSTDKIKVKPSLLKNIPTWDLLDKIGDSWISRIIWGTAYFIFYLMFSPSLWFFLLLPIHFFMGPIHGAIVNWCGHKYGYRNFKEIRDRSTNTLPFDFITLGELFQNNHHKYPSRPNFGIRKFEFDPVYPIMRLLDKLSIIKLKNN
ncbi:MAG: acyl-CoA desaturase [Candidatus Marinimicrobia bacterium]|nr:acyl-CoA desaturase [Candidatus Neomarinimicrobiota bacterium]